MKLLFPFLLFAIFNSVSGQTSVYHPFPDSNAVWNINTSGVNGSFCDGFDPLVIDRYLSLFISGDTTINNIVYQKIYISGYAQERCAISGNLGNWWAYDTVYWFSFRQDLNSKKIYTYTNQEILLYDFSLSVGDTVHDNDNSACAEITSIDSVLVGNNYRKRFNLSQQYSLIEGIGSTSGFNEPICPFEHYGTLICFTQDGVTLFPDSTFSCDFIDQVRDIYVNEDFATFSPNPFHFTTTLELKNQFEDSELSIYNSIGEKVRQQKTVSQKMTINRNGLPNGIYFYQIAGKENKYTSGKLIIE